MTMTLKSYMIFQKKDSEGHVLTREWQAFHKASNADKPKEMASILEGIREKAMKRHLSEDFYDAGREWVYVIQRRNWKERESARAQFQKEVAAFDEPIVTLSWMEEFGGSGTNSRFDYVRERGAELRAACHPHFHRNLNYMDGNLTAFMKDDEEYALWKLLQDRYFSGSEPEKDAVYAALAAREQGVYPAGDYLKYVAASRLNGPARIARMEALAKEFAGKAVSMYPKQVLMRERFSELLKKKATEAQFKLFYSECQAIEKERKAYRGDEKTIADACTDVKDIVDELTGKGVAFSSKDRRIDVIFKNIAKTDVQFCRSKDGEPDKVLWTRPVANAANRFFLEDTVSFELPPMDDGEYVLKTSWGKDETALHRFSQFRLSFSVRTESEGLAAYAADYLTGEPVAAADVIMLKGGSEQFRERVTFQGFTRLPERFRKELTKSGSRELCCEYRDAEGFLRRSYAVSFWRTSPSTADNAAYDGIRCNVYRDRGAYNPGNTLQFKAVVYKGNLLDENHTVPAGMKLTAKLFDSEDNEIASQVLETGEFGSAAGSFALPTGLRNGMFSLAIYREDAKSAMTTEQFRVDEFVLPTFDLTFDRREDLFFEGDNVPVSGTVKSFSGHSLAGATLLLEVSRWGRIALSEPVPIAEDGRFKTAFPARDAGFYSIVAKVTDGTGETLEFNDYVYVINGVMLSVLPDGAAEGSVELLGKDAKRIGRRVIGTSGSAHIITTPDATVSFRVRNTDGKVVPNVPVHYKLLDEQGKVLEEGSVASGGKKTFRLGASGLYRLKSEVVLKSALGKEIKADDEDAFLRVLREDTALDAPVWKFIQVLGDPVTPGGKFGLRFGAAGGPVWAVVTLYEDGGKVLDSHVVKLEGERGKAGSLTDLEYTWQAGWPEAVRMNVFYFRDGREVSYDHEFRCKTDKLALPLSFSSLKDSCFPGTEYTVTLQSEPGIEAVAAVYDKSLDAIAGNPWPVVHLRTYHAAAMGSESVCGDVGGSPYRSMRYFDDALAGGAMPMRKLESRSVMQMNVAMAPMEAGAERAVADEELADMDMAGAEKAAENARVREQFEESLTFQPFLRSDANGKISFSFRTSDKLSTYYVAVYAHGKDMRNAYVREETVVSVPVKVAVNAPRFLYRGDVLQLAANVASNTDKPVAGTLFLYVYDKADHAASKPVSTQRIPLTVPARGSLAKTFAVRVPETDTLGLKTVFVAKDFSDAVFQAVPVNERLQRLTEAHSAVLRAGMDEEALFRELRKRFVNVPGKKAESSVVTVLDMVRDAIPEHVEPKGSNVLDLSEAYYTRLLAGRLNEKYPDSGLPAVAADDLLEKILACRNADGGFGWFEGMRSSGIITAVVLDRFAKLAARGFSVPDLTGAVKWLDANQFSDELPYWCGWVSDAQYMHVRARYADVPFEIKQTGDRKTFNKRMSGFKEYAQDYLVPSEKDGRGLTGQILAKARRIATLRSLLGSDAGKALAKAWGIRFGTESKLRSSMDADFASLLEYAVEHRDGGWYYPNAVMPFRGLLESEAYAHSLLTDLLSDYASTEAQAGVIADGLRIWLMLQKETQKWGDDAAYVDAITSILDGSEAVLGTKVLVLKADFTAPFEQIKAAGNGFTVERRFFREKKVTKHYENRTSDETWTENELEEIRPGTPLAVGDKLWIRYRIWSQENRSFVRLTAPREASLTPVQQLSGHYGWGFRALMVPGLGWSLTPQAYRNVKADRTEYFFDSFPEENTEITETFHVTQAGTFTAPVVTVESLYAPHYRANAGFAGTLTAR